MIRWYARGGGIARCGPFSSQLEAVDAMRLAKHPERTRICYGLQDGNPRLVTESEQRGEFPSDVFVWPEEEPKK